MFMNLSLPKNNDLQNTRTKKTFLLNQCKHRLTTRSKISIINKLNQIINDRKENTQTRYNAIEKLLFLDDMQAVKTIINAYFIPENLLIRTVLKEKLLEVAEDSPIIKTDLVQNLKKIVKVSVDNLAKDLLNEIDTTQTEQPSLDISYVKKVAEKHPMTTPTALIPYGITALTSGVLLIGSSQTLLNDEKHENDVQGNIQFGTGIALVGTGIGVLSEAGRQIYNSIYTK